MHDDLIERRLRAALSDEARRLSFTITAAELQRRATLRGRRTGNQRLTLLLAAAVAIGALGLGTLVGGSLLNRQPGPTAPVTADESTSPTRQVRATPSPSQPVALPALDDVIATAEGQGEVLFAQSHDLLGTRADLAGQPDGGPSHVISPMLFTRSDYVMTIMCLGPGTLGYALGPDTSPDPDAWIQCDGTTNIVGVAYDGLAHLVLSYNEPMSWRVVVRGIPIALPLPTANPVLPALDGLDELVRMDDATMDATEPWRDNGLVLQELPALPGRFDYVARIWCPVGNTVRLILGDHLENAPELTPETETAIRCDGLVQDLDLRMVEPNGSRVFVAAAPGSRFSVLIASDKPPVGLVRDLPGWEMSAGFGPDYSFETHGVSFSNEGLNGGHSVLVEVECAGPAQQIEVTVDLSEPLGNGGKTFFADCSPGGARTGQSFATTKTVYGISLTVPAGTWTAVTALVPKP